jgi:hypothetical protein
MGNNVLRQVAEACGQLPRECLGFLEKASLRGEALTTNLVKELAREIEEDSNH